MEDAGRCLRVGRCRKEIASRGIRTVAEKRRNGIPDEVHRFYEGSPRISRSLLSHFVYLISFASYIHPYTECTKNNFVSSKVPLKKATCAPCRCC